MLSAMRYGFELAACLMTILPLAQSCQRQKERLVAVRRRLRTLNFPLQSTMNITVDQE
jgi:hypothetical protein